MTKNPVQFANRAGRLSRKSLAGVLIQIERSGTAGPVIRATVGETQIEEYETDGTILTVRARDYLIDRDGRDGYRISTGITTPKIGDVIIQTLAGSTARFEVVPTNSERGSRRSDRAGDLWRVHTKEITQRSEESNI